MSRAIAIILCFIQLTSTGCAAMFFDANENVAFQSSPDEATIRLNGRPVGRTPQMVNIEAKDYAVRFEREGCEPYVTSLDANASGGAIVVTVLGVLLWGVFEALSLIEGTGIYRDLPDDVYGELGCSEPERVASGRAEASALGSAPAPSLRSGGGTNPAERKRWQAECTVDPMTDLQNCNVRRAILAGNQGGDEMALSVSRSNEELQIVLVGDQLYREAAIRIDKNDASFTKVCGHRYCIFRSADDLVHQMLAGESALIRVVGSGMTQSEHRIPLNGFLEAFEDVGFPE